MKIAIALNLLLLTKVVFTAASSEVALYEKVFDNQIKTIQVLDKGLPKFEFTMPFYQYDKVTTVISEEITQRYVLSTKFFQYEENKERLNRCKIIHSNYPLWISRLNFFGWLKRSSFFILWDCEEKA